jgi:hypothetical protein
LHPAVDEGLEAGRSSFLPVPEKPTLRADEGLLGLNLHFHARPWPVRYHLADESESAAVRVRDAVYDAVEKLAESPASARRAKT